MVIQTVTIGTHHLTFYAHADGDSALLGFEVPAPGGNQYFPLYASTYRGLPAGTLEVYVSPDDTAMWVTSSWRGYELLAYHELGSDHCITRYGEVTAEPTPSPASIGGDPAPIPPLDRETARRVATLSVPTTALH